MADEQTPPEPYSEATLGERLLRRMHEGDDREIDWLQTGQVLEDDSTKHGTTEDED